jgi:hypothetical protein
MIESQLDAEQIELVPKVDEVKSQYRGKGRGWNRLRGDITNRIVGDFVERHLPKGTKVARDAWIEGCGREFDILVVDEEATPLPFTNVYLKDQVRLIIEVKNAGVFYKKSEVETRLGEWKAEVEEETCKTLLYLSFWERLGYFDMVLRAVGKSDAFVLQVKDNLKSGEWRRFIERVNALLS